MNVPEFQLPVPANPPDAGTAYYCEFGQDWLPIVLTGIEALRNEALWLSPPTDLIPQIDELMARIATAVIVAPQIFPIQFKMFFDEFIGGGSTSLITNLNTSQIYNFFCEAAAAANGDTYVYEFSCKAGNYTLKTLGITQNSCGKLDYYVDGSLVASGQDWYTATTTFNVVKSLSITIPTDGNHELVIIVNGKNASSVGFRARLTKFWATQ